MERFVAIFNRTISFFNEWRDTIFYSAVVLGYAADNLWRLGAPDWIFMSYCAVREVSRAMAWLIFPDRNVRYAMMSIFICESLFLMRRFVFTLTMPAIPMLHTMNAFFVVLHMTIASIALSQTGGVRKVYETYRDTLFDYPRKIKPPPQSKREKARAAAGMA